MAKKAEKRIEAGRVSLTKAGLRKIRDIAFQNCRTVDQELTYMIEKLLTSGGKVNATQTYDYQEADVVPKSAEEFFEPSPVQPQADVSWTQAQEDEISGLAKDRGWSDAQLMAAKFLHKTPEAVKEAIQCEKVAA